MHFNSSRDDTLFASDGGDASQVAYATDGMWINLLRVQPDGTVSRERLVNMSRHNYVTGRGGVEPNVHITPDKKWVIFTGQFAAGGAAGLCGRRRQTLTPAVETYCGRLMRRSRSTNRGSDRNGSQVSSRLKYARRLKRSPYAFSSQFSA